MWENWTPDFSGYYTGGRSNEAFKWKGGYPERVWRERGPDAYRAWLVEGQAGQERNPNPNASPASWYSSRINAFDNWKLSQQLTNFQNQPQTPDLTGELTSTQKQLADLTKQFNTYKTNNPIQTPNEVKPVGGVTPTISPMQMGPPPSYPPMQMGPPPSYSPMRYAGPPDRYSASSSSAGFIPPMTISQITQPVDQVAHVRPAKIRGKSMGTQQFNRNYRQLPMI